MRKWLVIVGVALAVAAAAVVYAGWFRRGNALEGSGTVEARNIRVGSKIGGRIAEVRVREGDRVQPGQVLVTFEDQELKAALQQARANVEKMTRGFRPEEIAEARAAAEQARAEYEQKKNGYRREDVDAARADLERAKAEEARAERDFRRYDALAQKEMVSRQQRDAAEATWRMAAAQRENAGKKLAGWEHGYRPEEIAAAEARFRQALATHEKLSRGNRREDIDAARAQLAEAEARYRERQVLAPLPATVEVLDVRPGDLIAPNTPVATLLERDQIYVRIYIPETELSRIQVGQKGEVRIDSLAHQPFEGVIEQINQQAEFLPRNVQTKSERVHQVFGVKVRINDSSSRVKPGMAADVKLSSGK